MTRAFLVVFLAAITTPAQTTRPNSTFPNDTGKKIHIAILQPTPLSGISEPEVGLIADRLRGDLFNTGRVEVMEREVMSSILREQGFQQTGACSEESCVAEAGQLLGVEAIIGGSIGRLGSVYMVNLRVIDVATGKLIAAVSRDMQGDIEQLISLLKDIAGELSVRLSDADNKESGTASTQVEDTYRPAETDQHPVGPRDSDNRNRMGVRLLAGAHWGPPRFFLNKKEYAPATDVYLGEGYTNKQIFTNGPLMHFDLSLIIKAGPFIAITVGPSFQMFTATSMFESSVNDHATRIDYFFGNVGPHVGVSYVKRMLPWKINAGIFYDMGFCWWSSEMDSVNADGITVEPATVLGMSEDDLSNYAWSLGHGIGFQGGMEYVFNGRIGINLDFFFRFLQPFFEFNSDTMFGDQLNRDRHIKLTTGYTGGDEHPKFSVILPMFGFDLGVNWYF